MSKQGNKPDLKAGDGLGANSKSYWQVDVSKSVFQRGYGDDPNGAFLPKPGKDRPTCHVKVNECDH